MAAWAGNTVAVAAKHYLTLVDHDWIKATECRTTTSMPSNSVVGVAPAKSVAVLASNQTKTREPQVSCVTSTGLEKNESKSVSSSPGEKLPEVSQSVSHSGGEMGVLEENLTKTQSADVLSGTGLTALDPLSPDIKIYPARIRT